MSLCVLRGRRGTGRLVAGRLARRQPGGGARRALVSGQLGSIGNGDPLDGASLVVLAARRLRSEILSGALVPGERLIEEQLTRRFGTSRAPLREALRLLEQQGLVEHLPRRGVRVTQLSPREVDELFGLRDLLERFAVRQALPLRDRGGLAVLEARLADMERAAGAGAALERGEAHRQVPRRGGAR